MGEPIKILDLAEQIIKLNGFVPYKDIGISFIGLRKGERMDEPLWTKEENPTPTQYDKILQLKNDDESKLKKWDELIKKLKPICFYDENFSEIYRNRDILIKMLCDSVPSLKEFYEENN